MAFPRRLGMAACAALLACDGRAALADEPLPYSEAVAARFAAPNERYALPVFEPGRDDFTSNDELARLIDRLQQGPAAGGTHIERIDAGRSQQGQPLHALRFSRGEMARPAVLLIGQQHGDEPAGAEALLAIAQALARPELGAVLDRIDVIVLPRANPDGAEWGRRVAANGLDINRDHLLLRTPEARAILGLLRRQRPVVVADVHEHTVVGRYLEKFGAVQRNDLLLQYATAANLPPALSRASEEWFRRPVIAALDAQGLRSEWYYTNPVTPGDKRLSMGGVQPDTWRNVSGLQHAVSLLLESRGVGIGRLHLARRVHSQVVALRTVLSSAAAHAAELAALQRTLDAEVAAAACHGDAVVLAATTPQRREILMLDPQTGADKPVLVDWESALELRRLVVRPRPCGYWIAADEGAAVAQLRALGIEVRPVAAPLGLQAEAWLERARGETARPDVRGSIADGAATVLRVQVTLEARTQRAEPGSHYVPLDQPLANLVIAALEPDTPNSLFANRIVQRLDGVLRVMQPPAALP